MTTEPINTILHILLLVCDDAKLYNMCIISIKNLTTAQKAKRTLSKDGIFSSVVNVDPSLTQKGCSYGLTFNCADFMRIRRILNAQGIEYGEILGTQNLS